MNNISQYVASSRGVAESRWTILLAVVAVSTENALKKDFSNTRSMCRTLYLDERQISQNRIGTFDSHHPLPPTSRYSHFFHSDENAILTVSLTSRLLGYIFLTKNDISS